MNFQVDVEGEKIGLGILDSEQSTFSIDFNNGTGTVNRLKGRMYGGGFAGSVEVFLPGTLAKTACYRVNIGVIGAKFGEVVSSISTQPDAKKEYSGNMN